MILFPSSAVPLAKKDEEKRREGAGWFVTTASTGCTAKNECVSRLTESDPVDTNSTITGRGDLKGMQYP
jgi:hypothetical protein